MNLKNNVNESGQTLIFVLLVMTISLAIGISISSRTISTVRRTVNVDSSTRALAAAEAGLEYYLSKPIGGPGGLNSLVPSRCTDTYSTVYPTPPTSLSNDGILTNADVIIQRYGCLGDVGNTPHSYDINQDGILELKTKDGSGKLNLCWRSSSAYSSIYLMEIYGSGPSYSVKKVGVNHSSNPYDNKFQVGTASGEDTCYSYKLSSDSKVLRILSLYNASLLSVTDGGSATLPYQGFQMTAVGKVGSDIGARRTVTASKSLPYLPTPFNFAVYSNSSSEALD